MTVYVCKENNIVTSYEKQHLTKKN
uniref:Uncharacterized protein n=1 Tax=Lepeophtheirus salmonis TaxID=72036 RepID=A0A0K2VGP4_LEPSM